MTHCRVWLHTLFCGLAAVTLLSVPAAAAPQGTGTIVGLVVDDQVGQPIRDVSLVIDGTTLRTVTNAQGRYVFNAVPVGTHTLRAERLGYEASVRTVTVSAGATVTVNLGLAPTALALAELVVTGVSGGGVERAKVPFSVSRLDTETMPVPAVNPLSQIQGKVPGAVHAVFKERKPARVPTPAGGGGAPPPAAD
jgi:outer membrane receptor for ferrienterochelin and colicins